ncbi:asparagine--tRNA ligase [Coprothermobacteraceae bacterium]|nr:asparagine--tRNA ligase [Coprothermobacteraceae bacterium]
MAVAATVATIGEYVGQEVTLKGWIHTKREKGKIAFIVLRDGTGFIQVVLEQDRISPNEWEELREASLESSVIVRGLVKAEPRAPGGYEIQGLFFKAFHVTKDWPLGRKDHGVDFLMDNRHLWIRSRRQSAILRIRHTIETAMIEFLNKNGFYRFDAPIITAAACEGTTTLFEVDYHGDKAYLSQSGQLYAEAGALALGKVYTFGPAFRAEKSKTRRHLLEFWMIEPEAAWFEYEDNIQFQEQFVSYIVNAVLERNADDLKILDRPLEPLMRVKPPFPRITYTEAVELLGKNGFNVHWGDDLGAPEETFLSNYFDKPVFLTHFPAKIKAFYMQPDPENPEVVLAADLLAPEGYGEIIGGSQRIHDYELLRQKIREFGLKEEDYQWYLDLRRYGSVPHSGFGIGLERTVAWICKLEHIREAVPFPRMLHKLTP